MLTNSKIIAYELELTELFWAFKVKILFIFQNFFQQILIYSCKVWNSSKYLRKKFTKQNWKLRTFKQGIEQLRTERLSICSHYSVAEYLEFSYLTAFLRNYKNFIKNYNAIKMFFFWFCIQITWIYKMVITFKSIIKYLYENCWIIAHKTLAGLAPHTTNQLPSHTHTYIDAKESR